jgi:hypothetical protein
MTLRYPGICKVCGRDLPAGSFAFWDAAAKVTTCEAIECASKDGLTETRCPTGPWDKWEAHEVIRDHPVAGSWRIGAPAPVAHVKPARVNTIVLNSGAVLTVNANGRCEDAPCCGCCT